MPARQRNALINTLAPRILADIKAGRFEIGDHLAAQSLADRYGVSRSPIAAALQELAAQGVLRHEAWRGYFVADGTAPAPDAPPCDPVQAAYLALAADRLGNRLPAVVSANLLRARYDLTPGQVQTLITRVVKEGWIERRAGYGLRFTEMLSSADALLQTYRLRLALEPAALREPGYRLDPEGARAARRVEEAMLAGGIETMSMEELYERGVQFHELIVAASGNPFFLDALRRINGIRRLLAYRSAVTRERCYGQARDHLEILDLLEAGQNDDAAQRLQEHLMQVIRNLGAIRPVLDQDPAA